MKDKFKFIFKFFLTIIAYAQIAILFIYFTAFILGKPEIGRNYYIEMYDQNGTVFYESNNKQTGSWVSLHQVSPYFLDSIIAVEDANFYSHQGVDYIGIARATLLNVKNQNLNNGASTISQQYVKTLFLTSERNFKRKIKEAFITLQLETHYSKDDILEGYINTIYFGHGVYGIQNAAYFYFGKEAKDLNLSESSLLAGIINGPSIYSPLNDETQATYRRNLVLSCLYNKDYINKETYEQQITLSIELNITSISKENQTLYYYKDAVLNELSTLGIDEDTVFEKGLKVYTNLNQDYQSYVTNAINQYMIDTQLQSSVIIVEPYTSKVLALSGGNNYVDSEYNRAIYSQRQIASTIKGLLYYCALNNGFTPTTELLSEKTNFRISETEIYSPTNYGSLYANANITLVNATALSDNIYAVKTHLFLGEQVLSNQLKAFGFNNVTPEPSLALGSFEGSIYDVALIYNTFASEGVFNKPYFIERIEDNDGNIIYQYQAKNEQLLDKDTCLILNQLLTSTFDSNNISYATPTMLSEVSNITLAAKTGTSDWDSLVVGYNPDVLVGIWVGHDDNQALEDEYKRIARKMFSCIINAIPELENSSWYKTTNTITAIPINPVTGEYDVNGSIYWFKKRE